MRTRVTITLDQQGPTSSSGNRPPQKGPITDEHWVRDLASPSRFFLGPLASGQHAARRHESVRVACFLTDSEDYLDLGLLPAGARSRSVEKRDGKEGRSGRKEGTDARMDGTWMDGRDADAAEHII